VKFRIQRRIRRIAERRIVGAERIENLAIGEGRAELMPVPQQMV